MPTQEWTNDRHELFALAQALTDLDQLPERQDLLDFLEKPHKWEHERALWLAAGRPTTDDPGWSLFARRASTEA